jgi:mannose/fructose/N-acetylgalactosamine-specific phosphotransferase system component IIC
MLFLLLILKYGHYFSATADLKMINIVIGVIFAYLYVELRQKLRPARQSE